MGISTFYIYVHMEQRFDFTKIKTLCSKHLFTFMTPS